jgi:Bifunctional DNA primase/polymerase, N-terminal
VVEPQLRTPNPNSGAARMNVLERRRQLLATGYLVIPLYGKAPPIYGKNNNHKGLAGWEKIDAVNDEMLVMWGKTWPDAQNTGVLTRTMPTLDLDILNEEAARALEDHVREQYEEHGYVLTRVGQPPKMAIPFRTIEPFAKFVVNLTAPNGSEEKIEFLADGAQVVAFGIHPETKQPYRWHGGQPGETKLEDLPYIRAEAAHHWSMSWRRSWSNASATSAPRNGRANTATRATARTPTAPVRQPIGNFSSITSWLAAHCTIRCATSPPRWSRPA